MNYLPDGRTKMTRSSGRRGRSEQSVSASGMSSGHRFVGGVCGYDGTRMREIRRFSAGMTGITVMRTGRLQILPWTGCGLGEIPGSRRSWENYRVLLRKAERTLGWCVSDGGTLLRERALHPVAVIAVMQRLRWLRREKMQRECIRRFWETPLRTGERRYYDNFLYLFAMLALSGNYRIY